MVLCLKPTEVQFQRWLSSFEEAELSQQGWSLSKLEALKDHPETLVVSDAEATAVIFYRQIVENHFEILFLATSRHYRRQGRLQLLLSEFIQQHAPCLVWLECRRDNVAALDLYRKCGFKEDGVRLGYYHDGAAAICMSFSTELEPPL